jgi:hypothetical protein
VTVLVQVTDPVPVLLATVLPLSTIRQLTLPLPVEVTRATDPDRTVTDRRDVVVPPLCVSVWTVTLLLDFFVVFPLFTVEWLPLVPVSSGSHAVSASTAAAATPTTAARLVNMAPRVRPEP